MKTRHSCFCCTKNGKSLLFPIFDIQVPHNESQASFNAWSSVSFDLLHFHCRLTQPGDTPSSRLEFSKKSIFQKIDDRCSCLRNVFQLDSIYRKLSPSSSTLATSASGNLASGYLSSAYSPLIVIIYVIL